MYQSEVVCKVLHVWVPAPSVGRGRGVGAAARDGQSYIVVRGCLAFPVAGRMGHLAYRYYQWLSWSLRYRETGRQWPAACHRLERMTAFGRTIFLVPVTISSVASLMQHAASQPTGQYVWVTVTAPGCTTCTHRADTDTCSCAADPL